MRLIELKYNPHSEHKHTMFGRLKKEWDYLDYNVDENDLEVKKLLGKIPGYNLYVRADIHNQVIQIYDMVNNKDAGYIQLNIPKNAYIVRMAAVDIPYQGIGLITKVYAFLIKNKNYTLWSIDAQTKGGKEIWKKLAKVSGILIFALDREKNEAISLDPNDLFGETEIYDTDVEFDKQTYNSLKKEWLQLYTKMLSTSKKIYKTSAPDQVKKLKKQYVDIVKRYLEVEKQMKKCYKKVLYVENNMTLVAQRA